jgi:sec-independent protein translocase protein TatA
MNTPLLGFLQNINAPEILLIFLIVLLLFGAKRLPELFKSFGKSIKEFKKATSDIEEDIRSTMDAEDAPKSAPPADTKKAGTEEADAIENDEPKSDA